MSRPISSIGRTKYDELRQSDYISTIKHNKPKSAIITTYDN